MLAGRVPVVARQRPAGLEEGQQLALVVGGAPADEVGLAVWLSDRCHRKWIGVPQIERIDRLDVVVGVEHELGTNDGRAVGNDNRMTRRRARRSGKTFRSEVGNQPVCSALALGLERGIG